MHFRTGKDIVPEPVKPGGVHPELGGQIDSQRKSAVHGVVKESPAHRDRTGQCYQQSFFIQYSTVHTAPN